MTAERRKTDWQSPAMQARVAKRYRAEQRFKYMGLGAIVLSSLFLAFLLFTMLSNGLSGFTRTEAKLTIDFPAASGNASPESFKGPGRDAAIASLDVQALFAQAVEAEYGEAGAEIFAANAWTRLRDLIKDDPQLIGEVSTVMLPTNSAIDRAAKGDTNDAAAMERYRALDAEGKLAMHFNAAFLGNSDSTDPTEVGIWGAFVGSIFTMAVTFALAFPIGVLAAIYLEEYAPRNRITDIIEVSINNLAAVPSIIFGLLGLAVFLTWFDMSRGSALVGGLTLSLMTMPVIVIAARNAIKSVPPSIREAALGMGASPVQVVFHHVLPLAIPGIMTGTIIGMARALGETAPLLLIGMRTFLTAAPEGLSSPATVLPMQIFLWSDEVDRGFVEKTSAAIIVLLAVLLTMNALAVYIRNRYETRW